MAAKMLYRKNLPKIKKSKESLLAKRRGDKLRREGAAANQKKAGSGCSC